MTKTKILHLLEETKATKRRPRMLGVRMSDEEYEPLERAAKAQGVPAATLARVLIAAGLSDLKGGRLEST
jgi:hypothetical protein